MSLWQNLNPKNWNTLTSITLGIIVGLIIYIAHVSRLTSYFSDTPETCINCHVMEPYYNSWFHSSHREHAKCTDCHLPHDNFIHKLWFKAKDGVKHSTVFTLRLEPQVMKISKSGTKVVQANCQRCHSELISNVSLKEHSQGRLCWECHREVPHGRTNSISENPNSLTPTIPSPVPKWLKNLIK